MKKSTLAAVGGGITVAIVAGLWLAQTQPMNTQNTGMEAEQEASDSKLQVIASFYPLYEFSKNVGGDKIEVSSFVPVGIEPHDWDPSSGDILRLGKADIFIYNGAGFEPFVEQLIDSGEYQDVIFVETTKGLDLMSSQHNEHDNEDQQGSIDHDLEYDPHVWLDPVLAKHQVIMIKDAMAQTDPQNAQYYESNANAFNRRLDELDAKIKSELSNCNKTTFMPFHDSFAYFSKRYELETFPLSGIAPESEATAAEIKEFVDFVKDHKINVIFSEELVDPRLAQALADEAGVQVMTINPLEGLTQTDVKAGKNYVSKMEENLANLKTALDCQ